MPQLDVALVWRSNVGQHGNQAGQSLTSVVRILLSPTAHKQSQMFVPAAVRLVKTFSDWALTVAIHALPSALQGAFFFECA